MAQSKGFLDRVLQFMGIQEESEPPQEAAQFPAEPAVGTPGLRNHVAATSDRSNAAAVDRRKGRLVSLPGPARSSAQLKVAVMKPETYDEVEQIADHLKERKPVIISLEGIDTRLSRRILDFVSGSTYALDGTIHRVGEGIFFVAPNNVAIDADMARSWHEEEELFT